MWADILPWHTDFQRKWNHQHHFSTSLHNQVLQKRSETVERQGDFFEQSTCFSLSLQTLRKNWGHANLKLQDYWWSLRENSLICYFQTLVVEPKKHWIGIGLNFLSLPGINDCFLWIRCRPCNVRQPMWDFWVLSNRITLINKEISAEKWSGINQRLRI